MAERIELTGVFTDQISPKLKKLNKSLDRVTKSFTKLSKAASKSQKVMLKPVGRLSVQMDRQSKSIRGAAKSWDAYGKSITRASRAARRFRAPRVAQAPRVGRAGGAVGGSTLGNLGLGGLTAAGVAAGVALNTLEMAARGVSRMFGDIVSRASDQQMDEIGMANSIQTLSGMSFTESLELTTSMMGDLESMAAALPGATSDYLAAASIAMDDLIGNFGSAQAVAENLELGEQSAVAQIGLLAQLTKTPIRQLNMDLAQIREGDFDMVGLFQRMPTLMTAVEKNVALGMGNFEAFVAALPQAVSPQAVQAMKETIGGQIEEFLTRITSSRKGILGGLREITVDGVQTSFIKELGVFFNALDELASALTDMGLDPMVAFTQGIQFFTQGVKQLTDAVKTGDLGNIAYSIGEFAGQLGAKLINALASIDFRSLMEGFNGFLVGLFSNIDYGQVAKGVMNAITAMFRSLGGALIGGAGLKGLVKFNNALGAPVKALTSLNGALKAIAKRLPGINAIVGIFDFFGRKAAGQDTGTALGGAAGGVIGGIAGAALGSFLGPVGTILGGVLGSWLGSWIGEKLGPTLNSLGGVIAKAWDGFIGFFSGIGEVLTGIFTDPIGSIKAGFDAYVRLWTETIPNLLGKALGFAGNLIKQGFDNLVKLFTQTIPKAVGFAIGTAIRLVVEHFQRMWQFWSETLPNAVVSAVQAVIQAWQRFLSWLTNLPSVVSEKVGNFLTSVREMPDKVKDALFKVGDAILNWARNLPGQIRDGLGNAWNNFVSGVRNGMSGGNAASGDNSRTMPLGKAISREQKEKPAGSHLVIANSSETIIPAGVQMPAVPAFDGLATNVSVAAPAVPAFDGHIDMDAPAVPAFNGNIDMDAPAVPAFKGFQSALSGTATPANNVRRFQRNLITNLEELNQRLSKVSNRGVPVVSSPGFLSAMSGAATPTVATGNDPAPMAPVGGSFRSFEEAATVGTLYMKQAPMALATTAASSSSTEVNVGGVSVSVSAAPGMNEDALAEAVAKRVVTAVRDVTHDELFE